MMEGRLDSVLRLVEATADDLEKCRHLLDKQTEALEAVAAFEDGTDEPVNAEARVLGRLLWVISEHLVPARDELRGLRAELGGRRG